MGNQGLYECGSVLFLPLNYLILQRGKPKPQELIIYIARALNKRKRLWHAPVPFNFQLNTPRRTEFDIQGFMAETGIFSSSAHKKSWSLRRGGPSPSRRSRTLGSRGNHAFVRPKMATRPITDSGVVLSRGDDRFTPSAPKLSRQGKRSPPPLGLHQSAFARAPELPLTSRASKNFALRPHTVHQVGRPPCVDSFTAAGSDVTALEIQRTQWLEEGCDKARVFEGMSDEAAGPETNDGDPREDKDGGGAAEGQDGARWSTSCAPKPMIAWGEAIIEPLATVSKTVSRVGGGVLLQTILLGAPFGKQDVSDLKKAQFVIGPSLFDTGGDLACSAEFPFHAPLKTFALFLFALDVDPRVNE